MTPDATGENDASKSGGDDLLDLMGGGSGVSSSGGAAGAGTGAAGASSMFDGLDGGGSGDSGGGLLDLDGFLGGGMAPTPAPAPQGPQLMPAGLSSTQEFGQLWGSHSAESVGQAVTATVQSPEDFMNLLSARCNLQGVQAIAASKFVRSALRVRSALFGVVVFFFLFFSSRVSPSSSNPLLHRSL